MPHRATGYFERSRGRQKKGKRGKKRKEEIGASGILFEISFGSIRFTESASRASALRALCVCPRWHLAIFGLAVIANSEFPYNHSDKWLLRFVRCLHEYARDRVVICRIIASDFYGRAKGGYLDGTSLSEDIDK